MEPRRAPGPSPSFPLENLKCNATHATQTRGEVYGRYSMEKARQENLCIKPVAAAYEGQKA